jgi:hypothetical protein
MGTTGTFTENLGLAKHTCVRNIKHLLGVELVPVVESHQYDVFKFSAASLTIWFRISPSQTKITCQNWLLKVRPENIHLRCPMAKSKVSLPRHHYGN